jgi:hypothetical protein
MADDAPMAEQLEAAPAAAPVHAPPPAAAAPPAVAPMLAGPSKHLTATRTLVNAIMNGEVDRENAVVKWTMQTVLDLTDVFSVHYRVVSFHAPCCAPLLPLFVTILDGRGCRAGRGPAQLR